MTCKLHMNLVLLGTDFVRCFDTKFYHKLYQYNFKSERPVLTCYDRQFSPKKSVIERTKRYVGWTREPCFSINSATNDTKVLFLRRPHSLALWRHCYENKNVNVWSVRLWVTWIETWIGKCWVASRGLRGEISRWNLCNHADQKCDFLRGPLQAPTTRDGAFINCWWLRLIMDNYLITRHVFSSSAFTIGKILVSIFSPNDSYDFEVFLS